MVVVVVLWPESVWVLESVWLLLLVWLALPPSFATEPEPKLVRESWLSVWSPPVPEPVTPPSEAVAPWLLVAEPPAPKFTALSVLPSATWFPEPATAPLPVAMLPLLLPPTAAEWSPVALTLVTSAGAKTWPPCEGSMSWWTELSMLVSRASTDT